MVRVVIEDVQFLLDLIRRDINAAVDENHSSVDWISEELSESYLNLIRPVPAFDWGSWERGKSVLASGCIPADFSDEDVMKTLLMIYRMNRFNDGLWNQLLLDGTIERLLRRLTSCSKK